MNNQPRNGQHVIVTYDNGNAVPYPQIQMAGDAIDMHPASIGVNLKKGVTECRAYAKRGVRSITFAEGYSTRNVSTPVRTNTPSEDGVEVGRVLDGNDPVLIGDGVALGIFSLTDHYGMIRLGEVDYNRVRKMANDALKNASPNSHISVNIMWRVGDKWLTDFGILHDLSLYRSEYKENFGSKAKAVDWFIAQVKNRDDVRLRTDKDYAATIKRPG